MGMDTNNILPNTPLIDSADLSAFLYYCEATADLTTEEFHLYELVTSLYEQGSEACPDWQYGATLIEDSYFTQYARELAEDCGMLTEGAAWPYRCIDWERAARELQSDYTALTYGRTTYWVR